MTDNADHKAAGVDISTWDPGWNPSRAFLPIDFVIQRAGIGIVKDNRLDELYPQAAKISIRGAYWYYKSDRAWKDQAEKFLSVIDGKLFHFLVVDLEKGFNNLNRAAMAGAMEMVEYLKVKTRRRVLLYFNPDVWNTVINTYGYAAWANRQDIWVAQYTTTDGMAPPTPAPYLGRGQTGWNIWQFGAGEISGTAGRHAGPAYGATTQGIDVNIYNGTPAEMAAWAGTDLSIPPVVVTNPLTPGLYAWGTSDYWPRPGGGPLTHPFSRTPGVADNGLKVKTAPLTIFLNRTNPQNKNASGKALVKDWGPSKGPDGENTKWLGLGWPGRNILNIAEINSGWGRVDGLPIDALDLITDKDAYNNPDTIQSVYDYNKSNGWGARSNPIYVPILGGPWWIDMQALNPVNTGNPIYVKVTVAVLIVRKQPSAQDGSLISRRLLYGASVTLEKIVIGDRGLWGKIAGTDEYIAVRFKDANFTSLKI